MIITPVDDPGDYRQGTLINLNVEQINQILGFLPNCADDEGKVKNSWGFMVASKRHYNTWDEKRCGIWDYKGSLDFSTFGPDDIFIELFGPNYKSNCTN